MTTAPHAMFAGSFQEDAECPHPPGAAFARVLEAFLRQRFTTVSEFDNWRDGGWVVNLSVMEKPFEIYFALYSEPTAEWLLAIAPVNHQSLFSRLLGRKPIPCSSELKLIATAIHELFQSTPSISKVRWFLGGLPESVPMFGAPLELPWPSQS